MPRFADRTKVSSDRSLLEIQRTLERYGADQFMQGQDNAKGLAFIQFFANDRHVRFMLHLPARDDAEFTKTSTGKDREEGAAIQAWQQACRQRWRALALAVKAKLEAVESGIAEFESEFLAYLVMPGDERRTVGDVVRPQLAQAYLTGEPIRGIAGLLAGPERKGERADGEHEREREEADYEQ